MRLVLVHGRAQGRKSEQQLSDEWLPALARGPERAGVPPLADTVDVRLPFYGAELDRLVDAPVPTGITTRGAGGIPDAVEAELLLDLAEAAGVTEEEITAEAPGEVYERGIANREWVHAIGRALVRRLPWLSEAALARFLRDVAAYLTRPHVRQAVNRLVAPHVEGDDAVVVGYSLGSIVTYEVVTAARGRANVPLLVTLGSPLGIPTVKKHLTRPLGTPPGVAHWLNASDERDPVALYARLDRNTFPAEIENVSDVDNGDEPHGIAGYLADTVVARRIAAALALRGS